MRRRLRAAIAVAAAIVATTSVVTPASANPSVLGPCGYDESTPVGQPEHRRDAKYHHCGDHTVSVQIYVDLATRPDYTFCTQRILTPHWYYLGSANAVNYARYTGVLC
ncbi:hypothetical protein GCM10022247_06360 [Allokutzneria multivorans]|uniref:Secreted protein n=1 Tax=Allokutzneria multivorans TaxID=1142134 RepID=A0ABP7QZM3_9PSEU